MMFDSLGNFGSPVKTLLVLAFIAGAPFILVWALNLLLPLAIPYTLKTWFASLVIILVCKLF